MSSSLTGYAYTGSSLNWTLYGNATLSQPWKVINPGGDWVNDHWTIEQRPSVPSGQVGFIDMGLNNPETWARDQDRLTLSNGPYTPDLWSLNLRGVEHVDAAYGHDIDLEIVGKQGFTTDGSLSSIRMNVGNHEMTYTGATRDSTLFTGTGWDTLNLIDHPDVGGQQYWSAIRRPDGQMDFYSLYSGYRVQIEAGGTTWGNTNGLINYGEVDVVYAPNGRTGGRYEWFPGRDLTPSGGRGGFDNIDLASDDLYNGNPHQPGASAIPNGMIDPYSDSFNLAYFNFIRYTSYNLYVGSSTVHDGTRYSAPLNQTTNLTHDLVVGEQTTAIDGRLRLYVRDVNSGLYNEFNQVYLGTAAGESVSKSSVTGTAPSDRVALYGFGGNDVLTGGAGKDYLFGGQSTYSLLPSASGFGNIVTGGAGADFFGVGNTNTSGTLSGTPSQSIGAQQPNEVATDVIMDWQAGVDSLRVLPNGTAVIGGLASTSGAYALESLSLANTIDLRPSNAWGVGHGYATTDTGLDGSVLNQTNEDYTVVNAGLIVARGLTGADTLWGSTGNDYLYGNSAANLVYVGNGGADRVYYDTFDGSNAKQYVSGFTNSSGTSSNRDVFYVNKQVIDAFYSAGSGRSLSAVDVNADYVSATAYSPSVNYLHDVFYNPGYATTNSTHTGQDGQAWTFPNYGSDGTTSAIGIGMVAAGYALVATGLLAGIGYGLIASGSVLGGVAGFVTTQPHLNATYAGNVGAYLNVLTDLSTNTSNGVMLVPNSTVGNADSSIRFLDFFQGNNAGDGYLPVVEFTANAGQSIYGYFALHTDDETFVFLVASRDNMVENSEAIMVAQIEGRLTAADFAVYDGQQDIYNYGQEAPIVLREPNITSVRDSQGTPDEGISDQLIADSVNPVIVSGTISGSLATGSYLRLYDGARLIYDGVSPPSGGNLATLTQFNSSSFSLTDNRPLGTVARQTDTDINGSLDSLVNDNEFVLTDTRVVYTVELVDGQTGIPTRDSTSSIKITGGAATIDGGGGTDTLTITETSDFLNNAGDTQIVNLESILIAASEPVLVDLRNQSDGFQVLSSESADTIYGSSSADTLVGMGGADLLEGDGGNDVFVITDPSEHAVGESIIGGSGTDVIRFTSTAGATLTLRAGVDVESARITDGSGLSTGTTTENIDASAVTNAISLYGNDGANTLTGGSGGNYISGGGGADTLDGGAGADTLDGGSGADVFIGGSGDDFIYFYSGDDQVDGGAGTDTVNAYWGFSGADTVISDVDLILVSDGGTYDYSQQSEALRIGWQANNGSATVIGGTAADTIEGGGYADSILGGTGNDSILGGAGADTIVGGADVDSVDAGSGDDWVHVSALNDSGAETLLGGIGTDTLRVLDDLTISSGATVASFEGISLAEAADLQVLASELGDNTFATVTGTSGGVTETVTFLGTGAADTISLAGITSVTDAVLVVDAGSGDDNVTGSGFGDSLVGGDGNDTINGGNGADTIVGGAGVDSLVGGDGPDLFIVANSTDVAAGEAYVGGASDDTLWVQADADFSGVSAISSIDVILLAQSVDATFDGATLSGQTISVVGTGDNFGETLTINGTSAAETIDLAGLTLDTNDIAGLVLNAGDGDDTVVGTNGADTLIGGAGKDSLVGGDGPDMFIVTASTDVVAGEAYVGGASSDTLWVQADADFSGVSVISSIDVILLAQSVDVTFDAAALSGQTISVVGTGDNGGETLAINGTSAAETINLAGLTLDTDDIAGLVIDAGAGNDTVVGTSGADTIIGGADTIIGGAGVDSVDAGNGNDWVHVSASNDSGAETLLGGGGVDTLRVLDDLTISSGATVASFEMISLAESADLRVLASERGDNSFARVTGTSGGVTETVTFLGTASAENISLSNTQSVTDALLIVDAGSGDDGITGSNFADSLLGGDGEDGILAGSGDDTIVGGAGMDELYGSDGADLFVVTASTDVVTGEIYNGGASDDTLWAQADADFTTVSAISSIEALQLSESADIVLQATMLSGNTFATVTGAAGGVTETVTFRGTASANTISLAGITSVADAVLVVDAGSGDDNVTGSGFGDSLVGGDGNDTITAGDGNDSVIGGAGADSVDLGLGNDTYKIVAGASSTLAAVSLANDLDLITAGFTPSGADDVIDFSAIAGMIKGTTPVPAQADLLDDNLGNADVNFIRVSDLVLTYTSAAALAAETFDFNKTGNTAVSDGNIIVAYAASNGGDARIALATLSGGDIVDAVDLLVLTGVGPRSLDTLDFVFG